MLLTETHSVMTLVQTQIKTMFLSKLKVCVIVSLLSSSKNSNTFWPKSIDNGLLPPL